MTKRIILGAVFAVLFLACCIAQLTGMTDGQPTSVQLLVQLLSIAFAAFVLSCFLPRKNKEPRRKTARLTKRNILTAILVIVLAAVTVIFGMVFLQNRRYYLISFLIILEVIAAFFAMLEGRKPEARELVAISVLCALAVAGRAAFYMLPQFKATLAVVIIAGVCFGGETGFLVGAVSAFVSNFFFGQGAWTPWQMFASGVVGLISGLVFSNGKVPATRVVLSVFGAVMAVVVHGIILNASSLLLWQPDPTFEMLVASCISGIPFDLIYGASTAMFLWFISEPMIEKLERLKTKYGVLMR